MNTIRIAAAQTPDFRNDVEAALSHLIAISDKAHALGAVLVAFPEGYIQGYVTKRDEVRKGALELTGDIFRSFLARCPEASPILAVGVLERDGESFYNSVILIKNRTVIGTYRKMNLLPGESVFTPGTQCPAFAVDGLTFSINICFDTASPHPAAKAAQSGAQLLICCANNMLRLTVAEQYKDVHNHERAKRCRETGMWLISSDVTGARDDCISWGPTAVISPEGDVIKQLPLNQPGLLTFDLPLDAPDPVG